MAESIAQQVRKRLEKKTHMTNLEPDAKFPDIRHNRIRHGKSGFIRLRSQKKENNRVAVSDASPQKGRIRHSSIREKVTRRTHQAAAEFQTPDLGKRVTALEKKVDPLTKTLKQPGTVDWVKKRCRRVNQKAWNGTSKTRNRTCLVLSPKNGTGSKAIYQVWTNCSRI